MKRKIICLLSLGILLPFNLLDVQESRFGFCDRLELLKWADIIRFHYMSLR